MAAPVLETGWVVSTTSGATASSLSHTAPTGISADDLLLIIVGSDDITDVVQFSINDTTYPGWTKLGEQGTATSDCHIGVFYKVAGGSEGNVTVDAVSADEMFGWYLRISGNATTTPINASAFGSDGGSSHDIPSVTTDVNDCLLFYGLSFDGADGIPTWIQSLRTV